MKLFYIGKTTVECSVFTVLLFTIFAIFGLFKTLAYVLLALVLHEICHCVCAKRLGVDIVSIELSPFGFSALLRSSDLSPYDDLIISMAGPVFSIVCGCICNTLYVVFPIWKGNEILSIFASANLCIGCVNLLPAFPLDGGRILSAYLSRFFSHRDSVSICLFISIFFCAALIGLGIHILCSGSSNFSVLLMGLLLLYYAFRVYRQQSAVILTAMLKRSDALRRGRSISLNSIALHKSLYANEAIKMLNTNKYNVITVLDDDMREIGQIDETELILRVAKSEKILSLEEVLFLSE